MNKKSDANIYFDSCVYLAYYRNEVASYGQGRINAIRELWEENNKGGTTIVTSALTICEVEERLLEWQMGNELDDFNNRFRIGAHKLIDLDPIIAKKAAELRHYYRKNPLKLPNKSKPSANLLTPDAIHLATAIIYQCDEFWTLDGLDAAHDKHKSIKPLWLNNKAGNHQLIIVPPALPQPSLPFVIPVSAKPPTLIPLPPPTSEQS